MIRQHFWAFTLSLLLLPEVGFSQDSNDVEGTRDYQSPDDAPLAQMVDIRLVALEERVMLLEEAMVALAEKYRTERDRRQQLEEMLRQAEIIH